AMRHNGAVTSAFYSPDGRTILTTALDDTLQLWDAATGERRTSPLKLSGVLLPPSLSPDGKSILTGVAGRHARFWDAATGKFLGPPIVHPGIRAAALSPDGRTVLTAGDDRFARFWPVPAPFQEELGELLRWTQVISRRELSRGGTVQVLDPARWRELLRQSQRQGGLVQP